MPKRTSIAVIVPTVDGREDHLERCLAAYEETADREGVGIHTIVVRNKRTVGIAWQMGVEHVLNDVDGWNRARGGMPDYLHLTADDLEPRPGWAMTALHYLEQGVVPAPLVYNPDGVSVQSAGGGGDGILYHVPPPPSTPVDWCAIPIIPTAAWMGGERGPVGPMVPLHYYTDDWFSHRARGAGWDIQFAPGYAFNHYDAQPGRGAGYTQAERARMDRATFQRYIAGELSLEHPTCVSSLPALPVTLADG